MSETQKKLLPEITYLRSIARDTQLTEEEIELLNEVHPQLVLMIMAGHLSRIVDYEGRYYIIANSSNVIIPNGRKNI